ncbi:MAG: RNA 2',3'-cyclic phosphodiesterase [Firmicutes bacterium]|nr:RNA 2',3'-cyclic phosphodiesterase [Bacillota bacterium]
MRLFIAIQLDDSMKEALAAVQNEFRAQGIRGNYTPVENMHLTLAFIGEYSDPGEVLEVMEEADFAPFRLEYSGIGSFDALWWAGIRENEPLKMLVRKLRHALAEAGIPYDRKKFRPHITLIRKPVIRGRHGSAAAGLTDFQWADPAQFAGQASSPVSMPVRRISLMLSTRGKHGMIYTELGSVEANRD